MGPPNRSRRRISPTSDLSRRSSGSGGQNLSSCLNTRISSSFDPDERQQMTISWNKRRTTKYANDHSTRDLQQTGKATLPGRYLDDTYRFERVFGPHGEPHRCSFPRARNPNLPLPP